MGKIIDVVYVLGTGSTWKNNEIRYSLRSLEKNAKDLGKIFIVGELPKFLTHSIIHIKADDIFNPNQNADGNIITKVLAACADKRLSDDFLFINDDHLILQSVRLSEVPAFHKGDMTTFPPETWTLNFWRGRLKRTMEELTKRNLSAYHFDCHTPILFNKKLFPKIVASFPYKEGIGLTMKSLYGNSVYSKTGVRLKNEKKTVFQHYSTSQLNARLAPARFMSFNDMGLNKELKLWLDHRFPKQSSWERSASQDFTIEIDRWLRSKRDYQKGVDLFEKYHTGSNLLKILKCGETPATRKKLEYKLSHILPKEK